MAMMNWVWRDAQGEVVKGPPPSVAVVEVKPPEIVRQKVGAGAVVAAEVLTLANDAAELLGYQRLKSEVHRPLAAALEKLELEVLDEATVQAYKNHLEAKAMAELSESARNYFLYQWNMTPLASYGLPIPEFVLRKAVQLKKEVPEVILFVEHFSADPDPFLFARLGTECYYVEVWDEPEFEFRKTK